MSHLDQPAAVLIVESNAVAAVDLSAALEEAAYRVLGPVSTTAEALQLLVQETPTLAVIDVQLRDGCCTPLIRELRACGVPFVVHSAARQDQRLNSDVRGTPWLTKPALPWDVITILDELLLLGAAPPGKGDGNAIKRGSIQTCRQQPAGTQAGGLHHSVGSGSDDAGAHQRRDASDRTAHGFGV